MSTPTPATFTSAAQPFALTAGHNLLVLVGGPDFIVEPTYDPVTGGSLVTVTFAAKDFESIGAATANEVAAAINAAALVCAPAGQDMAILATVNGSNEVVVTATLAVASNTQEGPSIQVLSMSSSLAALGITSGIYRASGGEWWEDEC